ncbi:MAG: hypothetical protein LBR23_08925 [Spirochaetaceae bacterium]|nr:hypothetical protein [Spirochaetaceae bacterium]
MADLTKKKMKFPHMYIVVLIFMVFVAILTYIVPAGLYQRVPSEVNPAVKVVDPSSYAQVERHPINPITFFTAILTGFAQASTVVGLVLFVSGAIALMQFTGTLPAAIQVVVRRTKGSGPVVVIITYTFFTFLGVIGFFEASFPFFPIIVAMLISAGYDRMTGTMLIMYSLAAGFTCGLVNPYSTGISQSIVGLPMFSGLGFRLFGLLLLYLLGLVFLLAYATKIKKDPSKSVMGQEYLDQLKEQGGDVDVGKIIPFNPQRIVGMLLFFCVLAFSVIGSLKWGWGLQHIAGAYVALSIALAIIFRLPGDVACDEFLTGMKDVLSAACIIGFARAIGVLLDTARITDTMVYGVTNLLGGQGRTLTLFIIFLFILCFDFFVSSASGKAVLLMPILSPIATVLKINQQVIVTLYHYADGISNNFFPAGALACLALCKVDYGTWIKASWKFFLCLFFLCFALVMGAEAIKLGPF